MLGSFNIDQVVQPGMLQEKRIIFFVERVKLKRKITNISKYIIPKSFWLLSLFLSQLLLLSPQLLIIVMTTIIIVVVTTVTATPLPQNLLKKSKSKSKVFGASSYGYKVPVQWPKSRDMVRLFWLILFGKILVLVSFLPFYFRF
jgi:hypothetical protein